jgi:hypothetical protein
MRHESYGRRTMTDVAIIRFLRVGRYNLQAIFYIFHENMMHGYMNSMQYYAHPRCLEMLVFWQETLINMQLFYEFWFRMQLCVP